MLLMEAHTGLLCSTFGQVSKDQMALVDNKIANKFLTRKFNFKTKFKKCQSYQ